jgi:hypothetical protein
VKLTIHFRLVPEFTLCGAVSLVHKVKMACCLIRYKENLVSYVVKKVKCTLVQALRLCTGRTLLKGSRVIVLLFHAHGTRRG